MPRNSNTLRKEPYYHRICRICGKLFQKTGKYNKVCDSCYIQSSPQRRKKNEKK
jgi:rRNA maturation endonuclease Nob1